MKKSTNKPEKPSLIDQYWYKTQGLICPPSYYDRHHSTTILTLEELISAAQAVGGTPVNTKVCLHSSTAIWVERSPQEMARAMEVYREQFAKWTEAQRQAEIAKLETKLEKLKLKAKDYMPDEEVC